ncbi:uncharacterized protein NESG_02260, partial [Nematocida ausubeli]
MTLLTIGIALGVYIYNKKIHLKKNNLQGSGSTPKLLEIPSTVNKNRGNPTDLTNNSTPADDLNNSHKDENSNSSYEDQSSNNVYVERAADSSHEDCSENNPHEEQSSNSLYEDCNKNNPPEERSSNSLYVDCSENNPHEEQSSNSLYEDCNKSTSAKMEEDDNKMESSENNSTPKSIEEQKQEQKPEGSSTTVNPVSNLSGSESSTKVITKDASLETIMDTEVLSEENSETQQIPSEENPKKQDVPSEEDEESGMTEEEELKDMFGKICTTYGNDYIPDDYISNEETQKNILKCFNEVVIEEDYKDDKHNHITLKDLLIELSKIQEKSNDILPLGLRYVSFKCSPLFKEDKYMHRLLLGYYNRKNGSLDKLKIEGF